MSITMQGAWVVSVKSMSAAFPHRFIISGASTGDGTYDGETSTSPVSVTGAQWAITIEHNPTGPADWTPSAQRLGIPFVSGGQVQFDIRSNDSGGDVDYNDLILTCSTPASPTEFVIYGRVRSYSGFCRFNPCYPFPYFVIDSAVALKDLLKYRSVRSVLEALYPHRVKELTEKRGVIKPPRLEPDPAPFIPMMIPANANVQATRQLVTVAAPPAEESANGPNAGRSTSDQKMIAARVLSTRQAQSAELQLGVAHIRSVSNYAREIASIKDGFRLACSVNPAPGILLRFLEYDRTSSELAGGPYTGEGDREVQGLTATDEQGRYIFRFSHTFEDLAEETEDIVAGGDPVATQLRPDVIVQVISGGASGLLYESALYPDINNLQRLDFCLPESVLNPGPTACQGGRAIQAIGNIFTIPGVGNTLDGNGRITATNSLGPQIMRGAWRGALDLFACFLDHPDGAYYTVRFRRPGQSWSFVQEEYKHIKFSDIGSSPGYTGTKVGPTTRNLAIDGGALVPSPSYLNIETKTDEWLATHIMRKIRLSSAYYENLLYGPNENPRSIDFRIEAYTDAGDKITGAEDTIRLLVDNRPVVGDIDEVSMGSVAPGECARFDLTAPNTPLTVRFRVHQPGGFVQSYSLGVIRGSNHGVPVSDTTLPAQPLSQVYPSVIPPLADLNVFMGTANAVAPDFEGYVEAELQPDGGQWLPEGHNFCAFEFSVGAAARTTNGYNVDDSDTLDKELIGISYTPEP